MDALKAEEQAPSVAGDLERVAEIRYGKLVETRKEIEHLDARLAEIQKSGRCSRKKWTRRTSPRCEQV